MPPIPFNRCLTSVLLGGAVAFSGCTSDGKVSAPDRSASIISSAPSSRIDPESTLRAVRSELTAPALMRGGHRSEQMNKHFILANGAIGATVASPDGKAGHFRFWLNRNDFWRDHLTSGRNLQTEAGRAATAGHYVPTRTVNPNPGIFDLRIPALADAEFRQSLDFYSAEVTTTLSRGEKRAVVVSSIPRMGRDFLLHRVRNEGKSPLEVSAITLGHQTRKANDYPYDLAVHRLATSTGPAAVVTRRTPLGDKIDTHPDEIDQFRMWAAVGTRVLGAGDVSLTLDEKWDFASDDTEVGATQTFVLAPGAEAWIATYVGATGLPLTADPADPVPAAQKALAALDVGAIGRLVSDHRAWWADYWTRSRVSLPDEPSIQKVYYGSLYVFGSTNRIGDYTSGCNSFGVEDGPMWTGDYHWNYNIQAPYYLVGSADRLALIEPYDRAVREHDEGLGRTMARMQGKQGTYFCIGTGPGPHINENTAGYGHRTNAVQAAIVQLDAWMHGRDLEWAKSVYPFFREVERYWTPGLLAKKETLPGGGYRYNITDNAPLEGVGGGPKGPKQNLNATPAIGMLARFYRVMLPLTRELNAAGYATGFTDADLAKWDDILKNLPAYPTAEADGRKLFLWSEGDPDPYTVGGWHWNLLQVYPCHEISLSSDPDLVRTALNSYHMRPELFLRGSPNTEWYAIGARLGNYSPEIIERLNWYIAKAGGPNHFFAQGGNIECVAVVDQINTFLLQSHEGFLRFFPAWPHARASFDGIRAEGAFLVSATLEEAVVRDIVVRSEKGLPLSILNPWPGRTLVVTDAFGRAVAGAKEIRRYGEVWTFATTPGGVYHVAPRGGYPKAAPFANLAWRAPVTASSAADPSQKAQKPVFVHPKAVHPGIGQNAMTWKAANLTDGNRRFASLLNENMGWSSVPQPSAEKTEWVQIDLGASRRFDRVDLWPMTRGDMRYGRYDKENVAMDHSFHGFPVDFTIQVSDDGKSWRTVVVEKDYLKTAAPDEKPKHALGAESFRFPAANARYVKVEATKLRKSRYFDAYTLGFAEIEVIRAGVEPAP